jgi:uncharacterized protein (TIGR02757 family)
VAAGRAQSVIPDLVADLLNAKVLQYNRPNFIENDPISIPHRFSKKQDIEIMGFWAAMLAWGQRKTIINKCNELITLMDGAPHDFVKNHTDNDLKPFLNFKHRTFNDTDALYFLHFFKKYYQTHDSLETAFAIRLFPTSFNVEVGLKYFYNLFFFDEAAPARTRKHVATPARGSSCKRLNMFLRWMVRRDDAGVDFGLWEQISPAQLVCPCDVHVDRVARKLGLIDSPQTNWQTAVALTEALKTLDPNDPVKYDFALFGLGVEGEM